MLNHIRAIEPNASNRCHQEQAGHEIIAQVLASSLVPIGKHLKARIRDKDEAEEVLQEFVLRALERAGDIRDLRAVRGWLSRVLASAIVDHFRRKKVRTRREVRCSADQLENVAQDELAVAHAICECAIEVLPSLKPDYAEAIRRLDLLAEPRDVVAARLGISVNTLTVRLHRARNALKTILEATCAEDCCRDSDFACTCPPA